jgi:hypothetical protein
MTKSVSPIEGQLVAESRIKPKHLLKVVRMILNQQDQMLGMVLAAGKPEVIRKPSGDTDLFHGFTVALRVPRESTDCSHCSSSTLGDPAAEVPCPQNDSPSLAESLPKENPAPEALASINTADVTQTAEYQDQPQIDAAPTTTPSSSYNVWVHDVEDLLSQAHGALWARGLMREQKPGYWVEQWRAGRSVQQAAEDFTGPPFAVRTEAIQATQPVAAPPSAERVLPVGEFIEQVKTVLRIHHGWEEPHIEQQDWSQPRWANLMLDGLSPEQAAAKVWAF